MAAGRDDGSTACSQSLSEPLETQGGKQMADVITSEPQSVAVAAASAGLFAWSTIWVYLLVELGAGIAAGLAFLALNPGDR
jgi:hypothetical protein